MPNEWKAALAACLCIAASTGGNEARAQVGDAVPAAAASNANRMSGMKVLDVEALAKQRGGADPGTLSDMKLNGIVANNGASNLATGANTISDGAFASVNGVPLVVQNSGNNVLIQNATIINVQVK